MEPHILEVLENGRLALLAAVYPSPSDRRRAMRELDQQQVDDSFDAADILTNCRRYPKDEAPAAYKDFNEVLKSVRQAELASVVAKLKARFVVKDASKTDD